uniref:Uncharacterized protein n=1 Tax=viral metagenome TaxID=1070528 RepID=A0A6C0CK29_9ZZZZ
MFVKVDHKEYLNVKYILRMKRSGKRLYITFKDCDDMLVYKFKSKTQVKSTIDEIKRAGLK